MHRQLSRILQQAEMQSVEFQEVIGIIRQHYECTPVAFSTGAGTSLRTDNAASQNQGSAQLLAFARRLGLDAGQTLALYAEHYRAVLADPDGSAHPNIRAFMAAGWAGVDMQGDPLRLRGPG